MVFLLVPLSPRFTLFPYTTLFRSSAERVTVVEAVSELFAAVGSVGDWAETVAVLEFELTVEPGLIWDRIRILSVPAEGGVRAAWVPVVQTCAPGIQAGPESTQNFAPCSSVDKVSVSVAE